MLLRAAEPQKELNCVGKSASSWGSPPYLHTTSLTALVSVCSCHGHQDANTTCFQAVGPQIQTGSMEGARVEGSSTGPHQKS